MREVFAYLCVEQVDAATAFYREAFGAHELYRLVEPSGRVGHAELQLGPSILMLNEPLPEFGITPPPPAPPSCTYALFA